MQLQRTSEQMTAGICNIPLTYPAKVFFSPARDKLQEVLDLFESFKISYIASPIRTLDKTHVISVDVIEPTVLKMIWRNFKTYRPHFKSDYRYLFWEIDNKEESELDKVLAIYNYLLLPVYVHETMRGYHFISIKPVRKDVWQYAISKLRETNLSYPPITLRILPNKYEGESEVWNKSFIISRKHHADTQELHQLMQSQNITKLGEKYVVVQYPIDKPENQEPVMERYL